MSFIPAYMPLPLRWKPVGESHSSVLAHAYCILEVSQGELADIVRRQVGEGCVQRSTGATLRLWARTDEQGVLMTLPKGSPEVLDPLSLPALSPLMCPLGLRMNIWWTRSKQIFHDAQNAPKVPHSSTPYSPTHRIHLVFDEQSDPPRAIEELLAELDDGPTLRAQLFTRRDDAFPDEILRLADDKRTWCVELHDHALEIAVDAAWCIEEMGSLSTRYHLPAHQLLLGEVLDVLHRRAKQGDPMRNIIPRHEHLCGGEYRALRHDFEASLARTKREREKAGKVLAAVFSRALHELSVHPYPEGDYERETQSTGAVAQRPTASLLLRSKSVYVQDELLELLYKKEDGLEARLFAIARGEEDPANITGIRQFLAETGAVLAWLGKASSFVKQGVKLGKTVSDPEDVEVLTGWIDSVLIVAAQKGLARDKLFAAVARGMRLAQVWAGLEPDFGVEAAPADIVLTGAPSENVVGMGKLPAERWHRRFTRAGTLLNLLNVIALGKAIFSSDGDKPSLLKTMTDLHGFVDGLEGTYRILSDTAETQLGTSLKAAGKLLGPVGVYISAEDAWAQFQTGDAVATLLATSSLGLGFLTVSLELAANAPHPAVKVALVLTGVAIAVASILTTDDEEQFLEQYRPRCESGGAYVEARNALSAIERALDSVEWSNQRDADRAPGLLD